MQQGFHEKISFKTLKEAETGRLAPGQGTTEADSSSNQRVAKETVIGETDTGQ
jgi:hypothetical protein